MNKYLILPLVFIVSGVLFIKSVNAQTTLPAFPTKLPAAMHIGVSDSPGGAAIVKQMAPFQYRYQYLAGGVNTGAGWATWNANGGFVTSYIQESIQQQMMPIFTYYMIFQSKPGGGAESSAITTNLRNTSTMQAYFNDLKLFFQKAAQFPNNAILLHVEPDMWGYIQQNSSNDNATNFAVQVAATNITEIAQMSNNAAGLAQAIVKLRDIYAPNVILAYHLSYWGTGTNPVYTNSSDTQIITLAHRSSTFYKSLNANFDLYFSEFRDRDAAFYQYQYGDNNAWWDEADYQRNILYLKTITADIQKRAMMWQIPQGNTKMRAMNNTWNHYQDNIVENLFEDQNRVKLNLYKDAGVIAFLFGRGADGATCGCDASGDGVTNPNPINNNTITSYSADDDGGYFNMKVKEYYQKGAINISSSSITPTQPITLSPTRAPTTPITNIVCNKSIGDANCDGIINLIDFEIYRKEFAGEIGSKNADFNNNGVVNLIDFEIWRKTALL